MSLAKVLISEFKFLFSNTIILLTVFGGSLIYLLLYPTPYKSDVILHQKIAIVDLDQTKLSQELIFMLNATPQVDVTSILGSEKEARDKVLRGEILGYVSIPKGFESDLHKGISAKLDYVVNASYFSAYGAIMEGINNAVSTLSDAIKIQRKILTGQEIHQNPDLLKKESIPLYNPTNGYLNYALAAILIFILHQTAVAGSMLMGAFQNAQNSKGAYYKEAPFFKVLIARILIFMGIYILLFLLYFGLFFQIYHINVHASDLDFWCFALALIFAMVSLGSFLGLFIKDTALPTQIVLISSLPIVFALGFIWPSDLIPLPIRAFMNLLPAYHGVNGFLHLNQMGAPLSQVMPEFFWLLGLGGFFCICAICTQSLRKRKI